MRAQGRATSQGSDLLTPAPWAGRENKINYRPPAPRISYKGWRVGAGRARLTARPALLSACPRASGACGSAPRRTEVWVMPEHSLWLWRGRGGNRASGPFSGLKGNAARNQDRKSVV